MSSNKKPRDPKRLFSKKNQGRRAPPVLHNQKEALPPAFPADIDHLNDSELWDLLAQRVPPPPAGVDPEDLNGLGVLKMSVVLENFMQPYLDMLNSDVELPGLLNFATLAWNLALTSDHLDDASVRELLGPKLGKLPSVEGDAAVALILEMVQRKHDEFEDDRRTIINAAIMRRPDGELRLLVASSFG